MSLEEVKNLLTYDEVDHPPFDYDEVSEMEKEGRKAAMRKMFMNIYYQRYMIKPLHKMVKAQCVNDDMMAKERNTLLWFTINPKPTNDEHLMHDILRRVSELRFSNRVQRLKICVEFRQKVQPGFHIHGMIEKSRPFAPSKLRSQIANWKLIKEMCNTKIKETVLVSNVPLKDYSNLLKYITKTRPQDAEYRPWVTAQRLKYHFSSLYEYEHVNDKFLPQEQRTKK